MNSNIRIWCKMTINILVVLLDQNSPPILLVIFCFNQKNLCSVIFKINKKKRKFFSPQLIENQEIVTISDIRTKEMTPH